ACGRHLDKHGARGLCSRHYHRAFVDGRLDEHSRVQPVFDSVEDRFFAKVDVSGGCWEGTAAVKNRGYGRVGPGARALGTVYAPRWAWEYLVGPIPPALTVDHLCRHTIGVNPGHLEIVTREENIRRANPMKSHCMHGHDLADAYI